MAEQLDGVALDAFLAGLERTATDFSELLQLVSREPANVEDWRASFVVIGEAARRLNAGIRDMTSAATGVDASPFFGASKDL